MADQVWFDVPAGSSLQVATSGTDNYLADAAVHFDMKSGAAPRPDFTAAKSDLDPGPMSVPVPNTGVVAVTVGIVFVAKTSTTVTVTATVKQPDGSDLTSPFTKPFSGVAGDGKQTCVIMARGDGI